MFMFVLATEEEIYKKNTAALVVEIIELFLLTLFLVEIVIHLIFHGVKSFINFYYNLVLLPTILILFIWTLLDIIDKDEFRELGAFRFLRVLVIVLKFNESREIIESNFSSNPNRNAPIQKQINKMLSKLHNKVLDQDVKDEIEHCAELINRIKTRPSSQQNIQSKANSNNQF